ncbi:MAG: hypothetical protein ACMUHB_03120 [Thermoplasmatota archaeon]
MDMETGRGPEVYSKMEIHSSFRNTGPVLTIALFLGFLVGLGFITNFIVRSIMNTGAYCFIVFFIPYVAPFVIVFMGLQLMLKRKITADVYSIREEGPFYYRNIRWEEIEKIFILRRKKWLQIWIYAGSRKKIVNLEDQFKEEDKERLLEYLISISDRYNFNMEFVDSIDPMMEFLHSLPRDRI